MRRWPAFRKANYAYCVKRNMPHPATAGILARAGKAHYWLIKTPFGWQKVLDNASFWSIIILTVSGALTRGADAEKQSQTRNLAATGDSQPAARRGHRRTLRRGQLLRSQRSRAGQVRDAPPGAGRGQVGHPCRGRFRFLAAILLPGAVGILAGWTRRPGSAQARPQAGAQAHRRSSDLYRRGASAGPLCSTWRTGAIDSPTIWHDGASTKHRARVTAPSKKTPLSESNDEPVVRQDLVAHYEQLRRDATGVSARGGEGLGLALFLRRGMTAWIQAWSQCTSGVTPQALTQPATTAPGLIDVRAQVVTLLAGIILGLQQEATP